MSPFGIEFYRALGIGFLIGCAGMALSVNGLAGHANASPVHAAPAYQHAPGR